MTDSTTELKNIQKVARCIKKVLKKTAPDYVPNSELFAQCGHGLRLSEWNNLIIELCGTGMLLAKRSDNTIMLALAYKSTSTLATEVCNPSQDSETEAAPVVQ